MRSRFSHHYHLGVYQVQRVIMTFRTYMVIAKSRDLVRNEQITVGATWYAHILTLLLLGLVYWPINQAITLRMCHMKYTC